MLQGHQNSAGYLTSGRIMPSHKEIGDHSDGFPMGEPLAVGAGGK